VALPTVSDLKSYLRIESTAEDTLLTALMLRAKAMLEQWIDVPITAEAQTSVDRAEALAMPVTSLVFPRRPFTVTSVVDMDSVTVPNTDYYVDGKSGIIYGKTGVTFPYGPYTITATCGLTLRSDYARLEPLLAEVIIDLAADLYQRRTPGASSETAAGTTVQWDASRETVARIMKTLRLLRLGVAQ
jgi:hypothetical protein